MNNTSTGTKMTKEEFYKFVHSDLVNFLVANGLDKITVDDGFGQKASVRITADGSYKVQVTSSETV